MAKFLALIMFFLILGTGLFGLYQGLIFPLLVKPMLKPKRPPS